MWFVKLPYPYSHSNEQSNEKLLLSYCFDLFFWVELKLNADYAELSVFLCIGI